MLMEQIDKHADLMAHILAGIAGGMVTKSMRDFIVKAAARRPGEVWQTNGRWYRKEGTRTVRIPNPGSEAEKKPAKAPKQAKPSKADLYASAKEAVAKLRGGDPGSIDEAMASLSALTVPELRKLAKESGLTKVPGRLKREIVEGLRDGIKASGGSVAGEPGTPSDAKAIKLTSEPLKELASEVAEKHGATVKGGELHTTYEQALEMISTLQDAESHFTAISKPGQAAKARWLIDALRLKHDLRPNLGTGIGGEKHRGTRLDPAYPSIDPAFSARAPGHGGLSYVVGIEPVEGSKTQDGKVFRGGKWVEEGPKEGDRNEDGLVFRNGRWHRDDKEISDQFIGRSQMSALKTGLKGEEADFFRDKINEINHTIATMPKTYEQDGKGDNAVAHLHYFTPGGDWYITERDKETEQHQAFGLANPFGDGGELGYISIPELTAAGAELDLYWKPKTLAEIRGKNSEEPAKPSNPHIALAATVAAKLRDGESLDAKELFSEADKAHGGTRAEGKYGPSDAYDSLEAGVNMSLRNGTDPRKPLKEAVEEAKRLEDVVLNLPTQTNRSGNKDSFQQFSTPPHYAYAAAWLANIRPGDLMLEPTAGTGSLAVHAANAGAKIQANELDPRRAEFLKEQFGAENVTVENADHIDAILHAKGVRPSVVVMNPPFSQTAGRMGDKKVLMTGANHIEAALKTLQPNGRLVAIVGRGMDSSSATFKNWFKKIGQTYNLRANVAVSGDVYKKYGTHFGTRVLVFDNTGTTTEANVIKGEVSSIPELMATLEGVRNDRRKGQSVGGGSGESPPIGTGHVTAPGVGSGSGVAGPITGELGVRSAISEPGTGGAAIGGAGDGPGSSERRVTEGGGGPGKPSRKPRKQSDRKKPRAGSEDSGGKSGGDAANPLRLRPSEAIRLIEAPKEGDVNADGLVFRNHRWHRLEDLQLDNASLTDDLFETYQPTKAIVEKSVQHNTPVVESAAMAAVEAPNVSYTPHLSPDIVEKGILSDVQLEAVIYAGQAHEQFLPAHEGEQAKRKGFFAGDGTGLGKGREIAGVIADNMNQGRKKHVWVSLNDPLFKDAQRDITALGISEDALFEFDELKKKGGPSEGICFMTYGTLRQKPTEKSVNKARNLERLVEWLGKDFDGVIAFDESHSLGNAMDQKGERGTKSASETALAGVELQKLLPNARVLYVSATGATEVENLAYAERLGIWGYGTAFPSKAAFITEMKTGGVAAMEAVAMSLKAQGSYMARSLSFKGIGYERLSHELTADQIAVYNSAAEGWQKVMQNIDAAIEASGMSAKDKSNKMSQFWGGELRFFDAVITSFQTQSVINDMEKQLAEGNSCVVQLTKTGAAQLERAIKEKDDDQDIEDLELGPKQILIDYLKKGFPVQKYESYLDEDGNEKTKVVLGADGKPLEDPKLVEMRDNLLADISTNLRDIDSPLDQIIGHFGVNAVAECTGRQSRRVTIPNERGVMETVIQERDPDAAKESETNDFQAGRKRILIFSDAGGTGRSYHADLGSANQQKRIHYLLQPGWRADKAVQGFGRSHRTNQKQPPVYRLVDCPAIPAQKRFVSTIARRLDSLGALTKGQRQTGSTGIFKETDNLESIYATQAMTQVFTDLYFNSVPGLDAEDVRKRMGLREPDPKNPQPPQPAHVRQFLNRMLVLDLDTQQKLFNAFDDRLVMKIEAAKKDDKFDKGVENFPAQKISKKQEDVVYTHPRSGAKVKHYVVEATFAEEKRKWEDNNRGMKPLYYVKNRGTGQVWGVFTAPDKTDAKRGEVYRQVKLHGPGTYQYRPATNVEASTGSYQKIEHDEAEKLWNEQYNALPASTTSDQHFVTGDMLTVWDRLPKDQPKIYRLRMDDGNTVVGRYVNPGDVDDVMRRLGSSYNRGATKQPTAVETHASVLAGTPTTLSNGWRLKSSLVQGERRIEIIGPKAIHASDLEKDGVIKERIGYDWRFFVPVGDSGHKTMERITALHPVVLGGSVGSSSASSMAAVGTPEPSRGMYEMTPVAEPLTRETVLPPAPAPEPVKAPEPPPFPGPGRLVRVTGDTYSNRKLFRTLGGTWDGSSWVLPSEKASVLQGTRGLKFHDYGPAPVPKPPEPENPNATKYHVSGNTFAHKDRIRAAGGKWDGANKVWVIPASAKDRIANLPGLKFTGKRLKSPIYVMKAMGEQSESLAILDALADILGGLYGKDALKHIPGLNRTPISKTYCILDGEVYRWSDGMLYKRLDGVWKASRHKPGEEWETRGRFYRREQGRTVRISKPGGKAIAVASDGAAEGTQTAAPKASKESAREAAKAKIAEIAKGGKSPESHKELMANLGKLTVVDLKAIAKEHNLKAPPRLKAALMQKLADHIGLKKTDPVSYEAIRKMRLEHAGTKESKGPRSEPTVDVAKFHAQLDSLLAESPKERKVKPVEKEKLRARNASDMLTEPESLMPANAKKKAKQAPSEDDIKLDLPVIKTPIRAKARA